MQRPAGDGAFPAPSDGELCGVQVGRPQPVPHRGRVTRTAIFKQPIEGPVAVRGVNLDGDEQADPRYHGGPDKAVYAYAVEDLQAWEAELGRPFPPGAMGENLTTRGLDVTGALIGERWAIGTTLLEVCQPRIPCFKLGIRHGDARMVRRFAQAGRPGAYLRIAAEGALRRGDAVRIVHRPAHGVSVGVVARAMQHDHSLLPRVLEAPELPASLRAWASGRIRDVQNPEDSETMGA